ncbi:MAG: protein kinase [Planctomycetota bacterium]
MSDSQLTPVPERASEFEKTVVYSPADSAASLVNVLDQYLADLQAGKTPDREQLLADHPELAHQLADCLAGIDFVHQAAKPKNDIPAQLGDFRIVREVGRGGMGVVYEAEQVSLKRRVALKVLRFGVTADVEVMQRFQREAETVAHLHHTNIVPIHAVGCEQGVHYYAMQFIEGQSLAAVLEQLCHDRAAGQSVDFRQVADWMLQAAEALAHAHQRGVIHRDIKPSNLILDPEGTVWLTDFGLAKRADEVTMTAAGILMGTPRYMSPEQATATRQPVDHRTDIYSLGATLYELATGKPVFDGTTPQGVITQILNAEPVSPRLLQGALPRDLETVILKCLAKDPGQRYQQARDLADDLRAYLDNRPIRARRATLRERAVRWARKHQRSSIVSAVTAAASLTLIVGGWFGWQLYRDSLQGRMLFTTDGPTLVAEVLNQDGEPVVAGFPVPNPQPVTVPAGPYQVRFSSAGLLSETWQLNVDRGGPQTFPVKLMERQLGPPINVAGTEPPSVIELDGQTHVVHRVERGWRLLNGETMKPVWQAELFKILSPAELDLYPRSPFNDGGADLLQVVNPSGQSPVTHSTAPALTSPAADLNGDGKQDLIFASRISPSLLAVSGSTGDVLWWHRSASHLPAEHDAAQDPLDPKTSSESAAVIGQPELVTLNGEPVVIAVYVSMNSHLRTMAGKDLVAGQKFSVEAVTARTGKTLWRSVFDLPEFATKAGYEIAKLFPPRPVIRPLNGRDTILLHVGRWLFAWDLETGRESSSPYELGAPTVRFAQFAQFADLDGDREPEAIIVSVNDAQHAELTLTAVSLKTRAAVWAHAFRTPRSLNYNEWRQAGEELAWTVDLNGDGRSEVLISVADNWGQWGKHWYGLELLDGTTGATRWQERLRSVGQFSGSGLGFPVQVLVGPDLDGDGHAEVFATSISSRMDFGREATAVQIDALSGQDGRRFWRQRQEVAADRSFPPAGLTSPWWWQTGDDGWPRLIVSVSKGVGGQPISYVIASHTGQLTQSLPEVTNPQVADINSDGIPDIWYMSKSQDARRMTVLQGMPPVNWRRPGIWRPASDFDADGTADFLEFRPKHLAGRSGIDGHVVWEVEVSGQRPVHSLIDLNGDGVDDVVVMENQSRRIATSLTSASYESHTVLTGFSGKTGERIWTSQDCGLNDGSSSQRGGYPDDEFSIPTLGSRDLDGDGQRELLIASHFDAGLMLAAFAARDGALLWKVPMDEYSLRGRDVFERLFHDLNGDGVLDVVISAPKTRDDGYGNLTVAGLRAYSGRDGQPLWKEAPADRFPLGAILRVTQPVLGDLDGDGAAEVLVPASERNGADPATGLAQCELVVLDGRSGERKWSWP